MATNDQVSKGIPAKVETPAAKASPPSLDTYAIQRRGTRVLIQERAPVQLHLRAAELLEISRSGALVEHTIGVRVGEVYRLFLPVQGLELEVLARAVRSSVTQVVPVTGGEGQIVYRTGLEFVELKETVAKTLSAYVDAVHQQTAGSRLTRPAAKAPEDRTRVPSGEVPDKGIAMRQHGRADAIPANQLSVPGPERRAGSRWVFVGVLILGSVLLSSLLYLTAAHTTVRWTFARETVAGIAGPAAPMAEPGGESLSALLSRARGPGDDELVAAGLLSAQPGSLVLTPSGAMAAEIIGFSGGSVQAGAEADLSFPSSVLSSIFGLRVSVPQRIPAEDQSDSRPQFTATVAPSAKPQPPAEPAMPQAETGTPGLSVPSPEPGDSAPTTHLAALPQPVPPRPEGNSVAPLQERVRPSGRVPSPAESPLPREDKAPRKGMNLPGADLRGADLRGANLQGADLTGARLAWARLTGAKLQGATLQGADLSEADLWMADLRGANLQGADLTGARLAWARLTGAKLQGATLQGADLTEVDLWMADLRGANLQKADLRGAKLTPGEQAAIEGEVAGETAREAIAMTPAPGEARPEILVEVLDPRRIVAERPREEEPR